MTLQTRQQEIINLWENYNGLYVVAGILIGMLMFPMMELMINNLSELLESLVPEALGITFTILIIDQLNRKQEEREQAKRDAELKEEQAKRDAELKEEQRRSNQLQAISELRRAQTPEKRQPILYRMLSENLLENAELEHTNLSRASLIHGYLLNVRFQESNLYGANLGYAKLHNANLVDANLQRAELHYTNLHGAQLFRADLRGTNLWRANLQGVWLGHNKFDENTMLPDAEIIGKDQDGKLIFTKYWTPNTDMSRYTDKKHPDFWQPDWVKEEDEKPSFIKISIFPNFNISPWTLAGDITT